MVTGEIILRDFCKESGKEIVCHVSSSSTFEFRTIAQTPNTFLSLQGQITLGKENKIILSVESSLALQKECYCTESDTVFLLEQYADTINLFEILKLKNKSWQREFERKKTPGTINVLVRAPFGKEVLPFELIDLSPKGCGFLAPSYEHKTIKEIIAIFHPITGAETPVRVRNHTYYDQNTLKIGVEFIEEKR